MNKKNFDRWVKNYIACWKKSDPEEVAALFTSNARYQTQAFRPPIAGRTKIVKMWMERSVWQGKWSFKYKWVAIQGNIGVLEGVTTYRSTVGTFYKIGRASCRERV